MRNIRITIFSGFVFLFAAFYAGILPFSLADVSRETNILNNFRETSSVKQGVSQDGLLAVTKLPNAPVVPPRVKAANHARTLRAFIAPDRGGIPTLYVESVKEHAYYALTGGFSVLEEYPVIAWTSPTTLIFYGKSSTGALMRFTADLHLITLFEEVIEPGTPIPTKILPSADLLP